jgi:hypothetical protein
MTEWLLLVLLVPAIVVPVVLLFGFVGCDRVFGLTYVQPPGPAPVIVSATGTSLSAIALVWTIDSTATDIKFTRRKVLPGGQLGPPVTFSFSAAPATHPDTGLEPATTYEYTANAIFSDGEPSDTSASIQGTTLAAPTFDAAGTGNTGSGTDSASATWSHTASGESRVVVVGLRWQLHGSFVSPQGITPTRSATYGGTPMTSLAVIGMDNHGLTEINGTFAYLELFGLSNPPTGTATVAIAVDRTGADSMRVDGCSVSYTEVSGLGSATTVSGGEPGTALTQPVSSAVNEIVVQMFGTATGLVGGYNQTVRYDGGAAHAIGLVIGDVAGAASVQFSATRDNLADYAGIAVRLTPII